MFLCDIIFNILIVQGLGIPTDNKCSQRITPPTRPPPPLVKCSNVQKMAPNVMYSFIHIGNTPFINSLLGGFRECSNASDAISSRYITRRSRYI